ncbi:MAG: pseudouridine synthase [Thermoanaerobaculia bacterium]|nr:pseudouridine synthase [Thermoanaerobaculia bacterium]
MGAEPLPSTLLDWLAVRFPRISRHTWQVRMEQGLVTDERGHPLLPSSPFVPRLRIRYFREVVDEPSPTGEIPILYRDDRLVVVDKPPFLPVTPSGPYVRRCVLYRLVDELGLPDLTPIHRLDRATSGVLLFASTPGAAAPYAERFAQGEILRQYTALARVPERPAKNSWQIDNRLVSGKPFFRMRVVKGTPNASTALHLAGWHKGVGQFELRPTSGKQHQLRLHLAGLGWPILGERYYPDLQPEAPDDPENPLRLVAKRLTFSDPHSRRPVELVSGYELDLESGLLARPQSPAAT